MLSDARLESFLTHLPRLKIALLGDLFLDRYLELEPGVEEYSVETGLEAYQITRVRNACGALGTVLNNLTALGVGLLVPVTVLGDDGHGYDLLRELRRLPVNAEHVVASSARLTPTYTKPLRRDAAGQWQELNRLDVRTRGPLDQATTDEVCRRLRSAFHDCDGLIVLDQINEWNWGVVNDQVRDELVQLAQAQPSKLIYSDSRAHLQRFSVGMLKGNRREVTAATDQSSDDDQVSRAAVIQLAGRTQQVAFCTCGDQGILVATPQGSCDLVPGIAVPGPLDICGAGDAATSGIVSTLLAGGDPQQAAYVGNLVASITVQQLGTTGTATPQQVLQRHQEFSGTDAKPCA
ncbi:MAG: bifunctional heptose 7-phosphate kinase/heptose 1-phosphate adenyltransferase [Planctomycetota bacterium]